MKSENIGKEIKRIISFVLSIETVACVITGVAVACIDFEYLWWVGLLILVVGSLLCWLSYLLIYAFGELVDKVCLIEQKLTGTESPSSNQNEPNNKSFSKLSSITPLASSNNQSTKQAAPNEWKCPACGVINQNYVGTCGCGQTKP